MPSYNFPSIDAKNPFYCPSVPAAAYLDSLRRRLSRTGPYSKSTNNQYFLKSFARILDKALLSDDSDNDDDDDDTSAFLEPSSRINLSHRELELPSPETSEDHPLGFEYTIPTWEYEDIDDLSENPWVGIRGQPVPSNPPGLQNLKRKRTSFSDIRGPEKHAKSFQSVHDSSFDVSVKHEKLRYSELDIPRPRPYRKTIEPNAESTPHIKPEQKCNENDTVQLQFKLRIRALEDELYGSPIGTESPCGINPLIERLDYLFPGTRLKDRLLVLDDLSHQGIADFLASHGYVNARVMAIFRTSEIQQITLTDSLLDKNGLNLSAKDILPVFSKPNSFLFLSELSLSGTPVQDFDITHINRLPKLSTLVLNDTAISNEAIFLLLPLKRTLTHLCIAMNPQITDDVVPALLLLSKLTFLSILDTNINMPGLRRLARTIYDDDRVIDIEIPTACEDYVDTMHTKYLLNPRPPLITNPQVCPQLSIAALQRNLAAHAQANPTVMAAGSKEEMIGRLQELLQMRKMDMLVRDMILGFEPDERDDGG